jgi:hypothetical protein
MTTRTRDLLYDAWVETWGAPVTLTERQRLNKALRELREVNATPEQVRYVLGAYEKEFRGCVRSPQGVTGNWSLLLNSRRKREMTRRGETTCPHGVDYFDRCQECIDA